MRNNKQMFELASAMALDIGPRFVDRDTGELVENPLSSYRNKVVVGYALCQAEISRLYLREGFSYRAKVWEDHIKAWMINGMVEEWNHWYFFRGTGRQRELTQIANLSPAVDREVVA